MKFPNEELRVKLKDGRTLGYAEYGDPKGNPVFSFHGWPGSRLAGRHVDETAKKLHIRLICPDRPGIGNSTYQKNRKLLDWPKDVVQMANNLKIRRFSVIGKSGGGPYALACAFQIPERINKIGIVSGLGPIKKLDLFNKLDNKMWTFGVRNKKVALKIMSRVILVSKQILLYIPGFYNTLSKLVLSEYDRNYHDDPKAYEIDRATNLENYKNGASNSLVDWEIYTDDWGFDLGDIRKKIYLWHGNEDTLVPVDMAKYTVSCLPNCIAKFYPTAGHALLWKYGYEILKTIKG